MGDQRRHSQSDDDAGGDRPVVPDDELVPEAAEGGEAPQDAVLGSC
jgi:hypothetical protein